MRVITILCWSVAALALIGIAVWVLTGTVYGFGSGASNGFAGIINNVSVGSGFERLTGPYQEVGAYDVAVDNIDSIKADWIAGGITVKPYDGDAIRVTEYAQRELRDDEKLSLGTTGRTLTIRFYENYSGIKARMPSKRLEILVPRELSKSLAKLTIDSTSGDVSIEDFRTAELIVGSISGKTALYSIDADRVEINSTSGGFTADAVTTGEMKIRSISGAINLTDVNADLLDCHTTSGAKDLNGTFTNVKLHSISGKISIKDKVVPESMSIETTSGSITIAIPDEGAVTVNHSSTSGKLSSEIPITTHVKDAQFRISTISGSVNIIALG